MLEEVKDCRKSLLKHVKGMVLIFFLNLFMAVWYEYRPQTTFNIVLQTVHLTGLVIMIKNFYTTYTLNLRLIEAERKVMALDETKKMLDGRVEQIKKEIKEIIDGKGVHNGESNTGKSL
jgi:hypothetical protein